MVLLSVVPVRVCLFNFSIFVLTPHVCTTQPQMKISVQPGKGTILTHPTGTTDTPSGRLNRMQIYA
ncbi:MAG: hypothetical protein U9N81_02695, partial [Bacillota bacterium]|nr:hypothetical protein [Bacillota bacterium]